MSKSKRQIKTKTLVKVKKKTWHQIIAPSLFNNQVLGQSLVGEGTELIGKTIAANAMNLTGDMKKQHIIVTFKVTDVKDGQGLTAVRAYEINSAFIKRLVRRNKNKLDLSFVAVTKDDVHLRIKPVLLTKNRASGAVCAALRKKAHDVVVKLMKTIVFEDIIRDLILNKLQSTIRNELKKVYPIKTAEIRLLTREDEKEHGSKESIEATEAEKPKRKQKAQTTPVESPAQEPVPAAPAES